MKTKFNNRELAHVWANQRQETGRSNSMFFEGKDIYSRRVVRLLNKDEVVMRPCWHNNPSFSKYSLDRFVLLSDFVKGA